MTTPEAGQSAASAADRPGWRRHAPLLLLLAASAAVYLGGLHRYLSLEALLQHRAELSRLVADNRALALLAFALVYAISVALSFPARRC